jgi:hypothetical protein
MQGACGDAELPECRDLVVHQGDEGGDHQRSAWAAHGGDLVAQAFAGACRHEHERVAAFYDVADGGLLQASEGFVAEDAG